MQSKFYLLVVVSPNIKFQCRFWFEKKVQVHQLLMSAYYIYAVKLMLLHVVSMYVVLVQCVCMYMYVALY